MRRLTSLTLAISLIGVSCGATSTAFADIYRTTIKGVGTVKSDPGGVFGSPPQGSAPLTLSFTLDTDQYASQAPVSPTDALQDIVSETLTFNGVTANFGANGGIGGSEFVSDYGGQHLLIIEGGAGDKFGDGFTYLTFAQSFPGQNVYDLNGDLSKADSDGNFYDDFSNTDVTFKAASIETTEISAAPEPGTWALMFAGVALMGAMLRRRRQGVALAA